MAKFKKIILLGLFSFILVTTSCDTGLNINAGSAGANTNTTVTTEPNSDLTENSFFDAEKVIDGSDANISWAFFTQNLDAKNCNVEVSISVEMAVVNKSSKNQTLKWQINAGNNTYPEIVDVVFKPGITGWTQVTGTNKKAEVAASPMVYLSTYETDKENLKVFIKNFKITNIKKTDLDKPAVDESKNWLSDTVPSLKETYKDYFDYIGMEANSNNLPTQAVLDGLKKHASTTTMENELKPQSIMGWWNNEPTVDGTFTSSKGVKIKTPKLNGLNNVGKYLNYCKTAGIKMRGHVLVWHSQTEECFFTEDYKKPVYADANNGTIKNKASKEEMDARLEWYIKTVLEYVNNWEKENNNGEHIIWAWDVVNEAMADDAEQAVTANWLRGSTSGTKNKAPNATDIAPASGGSNGSRWYQAFESEEYIINAFRYANKYAPKDIKLCYNDYNEFMDYSEGWKTTAICHIVEKIKAHEADAELPTRFDAVGMQSHLRLSWPSLSDYEKTIKRFLNLGVDIHVTELDVTASSNSECKKFYGDYFNIIKNYGNKCTDYNGHKITSVTLWGINDENSWINRGGNYPLLFTKIGDKYYAKDAFQAVIDAVK